LQKVNDTNPLDVKSESLISTNSIVDNGHLTQ
jgi:hypothetical protein